MRSNRFVPWTIAVVSSLVFAGLLTAATLKGRTAPLTAGGNDQTDAAITRATANLLEHSQFSHHQLDADLAAKFLRGYLDSLDPARRLFLQSDIQEFNGFRSHLADLTLRQGDLTPERVIFHRYLERLGQQNAYVTNLLRSGEFAFTGHETFSLDRTKAQRPADLQIARELWRQNVRAEYLQEKLAGKTIADIAPALTLRYTRRLQAMKNLAPEDVLDVYLNALAHVYDPHSDYLGHEQLEDFSIAMNLSLFGIGATLTEEDGYCKISSLVPGGPAARSGLLKPGDRIVAVGQQNGKPVDIVDMPLPDAVKLIRGPKGTRVRLTLIPAGAADASTRKAITLVRDEVKLEDQQAKARLVDWPQTNGSALRLGVIDLPAFYGGFDRRKDTAPSSATADVAKLIRKLEAEHIEGLILDLRQNGGGSLEEAIRLTGLFIQDGPVVQTREPDGHITVDCDTDSAELYNGPLIVLTSRFSASASEILAGALQDYGRALIVGDECTFGKGTVQNILPLARFMDRNGMTHTFDPGALKVTIQKFYRPSGASTQLKGVIADVVVPSLSDVADVGEARLQNPLSWDRVPSADFNREDHVTSVVEELRALSATRVAKDKDFALLRDRIAQFKKSLATQTISVNEVERRRENQAAKTREDLQKQELLALGDSQPRTYDITVENADTPGLPTPVTSKESAPTAKMPVPATDKLKTTGAAVTPGDPVLRESEHILADYVDLLHHSPAVAIAH